MTNNYNAQESYMGMCGGTSMVRVHIDDVDWKDLEEPVKIQKVWDVIYAVLEARTGGTKFLKHSGDYVDWIDLKDYPVTVYDGVTGQYEKVKKIMRCSEPAKGEYWTRVYFENGTSAVLTSDHPLNVFEKGRTKVKDIQIGDVIVSEKDNFKVESIKKIKKQTPGYDFETASDRFDINGFSSHNCRTKGL